MKAIIMAGGEGTRLRPLTCNRPKPMIPVLNRPVIEYTVHLLKQYGITDITMSLFYLPENVVNYFGDGTFWDVSIDYSIEEMPLGTAGGVKHALKDYDDTFIVLSGDGIYDFNIQDIIAFHKKNNSLVTIALTRVPDPIEYGIVITREDGTIERFLEKPSWGEVFSDTVNTGLYIIEPEIMEQFVPQDEKFDFSYDLFPLLQKNDIPLYGYIAPGYWCDIGNLEAYRKVHMDILNGLVRINFPGKKIGENIWAGKDVEIHPDSTVVGPVVLGNFVKIKKGAEVSEYSVIGDNTVIHENASVRRSVVLHNTIIGTKTEVRGAIIGKRNVIEDTVSIYEGAVISDDCQVGNNAKIAPGIRIWPEKIIDQGTQLNSDLIWGKTEKKILFSNEGIYGSFNIKITPEFAAKLGSAIGAYLGKNKKVIVSRDTTRASRLIKRALTAGLLSMGVEVYDLEIASIPINKYSVVYENADLGIYVQISPHTDLQFNLIRIFNKKGFELNNAERRKIENIFFRGDYPRSSAFEVGRLYYPTHNVESYIMYVSNFVNKEIIAKKQFNVIVDCFYGATTHVFPALLAAFSCTATVMRGQIREFNSTEEIRNESRDAINGIKNFAKLNNEIGVIIGPHGEQITVVDEEGTILQLDDITTLLGLLFAKHRKIKELCIPVITSSRLETIAKENHIALRRVSHTLLFDDEIAIFSKNSESVYPHIIFEYDPMITFLLLLELVALEGKKLSEIRRLLPHSNMYHIVMPCPVDAKALVMREIASWADGHVELIDGVRVVHNNGWILILPDTLLPSVHIYCEGVSDEARDTIINNYSAKIKKITEKYT
ncbi:MAG: sugar phosphate nucleotidyltransferase [Spirochaetes bacterium]|nr:sugar phosphate nucleotidyltransferase [Spirochaetota bacterium]